MSPGTDRKWIIGFLACAVSLTAAACEQNTRDIKNVTVTEDNRDELYNEVRTTNVLTGEETDLLRAYLARSGDERLQAGKTLAEMIAEQRGYESRDEASGIPTPGEAAAPPAVASTADPAETMQPPRDTATPSEPAPAPTATPAPVVSVVLEAGTEITVWLEHAVSSERNAVGDTFEASLGEDLRSEGRLLAPKGSLVLGRVVEATKSGKVKGRARLALALESVQVGTVTHPFASRPLVFEAESNKGSDAKKVGIGAGAGAIIGAITGGKKGALVGTVIGASAGTGVVLLTSGDEVELPAEQELRFELSEDARLPETG